jgi:hypothetical protein
METAAELGLPAALILLSFFTITSLKLLPIARARQTEDDQFEACAAQGVVLAAAGFIVSGQFVSAPTLEVPYYVMLVGIALLKTRSSDPIAVTLPGSALLPWQKPVLSAGVTKAPVPTTGATLVHR